MARVKFTVEVTLEYDYLEVTGHEAQNAFLEEMPNESDYHFQMDSYKNPYHRVHLNHAEIVEGLLDKDDRLKMEEKT